MYRPTINRTGSRIRIPKLRLQHVPTRVIEATSINSSSIMTTQRPIRSTSNTACSSKTSQSCNSKESACSHIQDQQESWCRSKQAQSKPSYILLPWAHPDVHFHCSTIPRDTWGCKPWLEMVIGSWRNEVRVRDQSRRCGRNEGPNRRARICLRCPGSSWTWRWLCGANWAVGANQGRYLLLFWAGIVGSWLSDEQRVFWWVINGQNLFVEMKRHVMDSFGWLKVESLSDWK